jgi:uncharacterized protein (DUF433 family)
MKNLKRITFDPAGMGGYACIRGMRITVSLILNLISNGMTSSEIIKEYTYLEEDDICQSLQDAAWLADETVQVLEMEASSSLSAPVLQWKSQMARAFVLAKVCWNAKV